MNEETSKEMLLRPLAVSRFYYLFFFNYFSKIKIKIKILHWLQHWMLGLQATAFFLFPGR